MKSSVFAIFGILIGIFLCIFGYHTIAGSITFTNFIMNMNSNYTPERSLTPVLAVFVTGIIASLFGFIGILLEKSNKKIAAVEYIICGIFVLFGGVFLFGGLSAIFFFVAGYIANGEGEKIKKRDIELKSLVQCPYCKSSIHKDVQKCKFCGEWVNNQEERMNIGRNR